MPYDRILQIDHFVANLNAVMRAFCGHTCVESVDMDMLGRPVGAESAIAPHMSIGLHRFVLVVVSENESLAARTMFSSAESDILTSVFIFPPSNKHERPAHIMNRPAAAFFARLTSSSWPKTEFWPVTPSSSTARARLLRAPSFSPQSRRSQRAGRPPEPSVTAS